MVEIDVDPQELAAARAELRRVLGSDLISKASDAFCLAHYRRRSGRPAALAPDLPAPGMIAFSPVASVAEFTAGAPVPRLPRLINSPDWSQLSGAFDILSASISSSLPVRVPTTLRQVLVEVARAAAYRVVTPAYDEIERLSRELADPAPTARRGPQVLTTQVCWLNRTLRTWAGPEVLAEVAADEGLTGVDVPRRIEPDVLTRNHVAVGHDEAFITQSGLVGAGVSIAVIDTEVALTHPALAGRVVHRGNYTAEPWGNPSTHGTAVAGIIAADDPVNGGIAPAATLCNYKVMATDSFLSGDDFGGALAIQQALEDNVDIANCSWGAGPVASTPSREARAADAAWALGLTIVKSAGNAGPAAGTMTTPADAAGIIVVGATDLDGTCVPDYSSRGPAGPRVGPDVVAPGGSEKAAIECCLVDGGFGDAGAGTSYSAPHVAGLLALLLQDQPHLGPDDLLERLLRTARPLADVGTDAQGNGLARIC